MTINQRGIVKFMRAKKCKRVLPLIYDNEHWTTLQRRQRTSNLSRKFIDHHEVAEVLFHLFAEHEIDSHSFRNHLSSFNISVVWIVYLNTPCVHQLLENHCQVMTSFTSCCHLMAGTAGFINSDENNIAFLWEWVPQWLSSTISYNDLSRHWLSIIAICSFFSSFYPNLCDVHKYGWSSRIPNIVLMEIEAYIRHQLIHFAYYTDCWLKVLTPMNLYMLHKAVYISQGNPKSHPERSSCRNLNDRF